MFARPPMVTPMPADVVDVDACSDAELDALPFGVIGLDAEGVILRYNLYESRLARLDRNQVIGRRFFGEVAPCTRGEGFEGRFRRFVASPTGEVERFDYLFDFKFGAQRVVVEMVRARHAARYYLLVNRTHIEAARPNAPLPAPTQGELAPDEASLGVLRDALARRFASTPASFFASLRGTLERLAPESWPIFASEWGVQLGRRIAIDLEASAIESGAAGLGALPMAQLSEEVARWFAERGFGAVRLDYSRAREGMVLATIERSILAEASARPVRKTTTGEGGSDLACHLLAGAIGGVMSHVAGRRLGAREVSCRAAGHDACTIVLTSEERLAAVDRALDAGARGLAPVLAHAAAAEKRP